MPSRFICSIESIAERMTTICNNFILQAYTDTYYAIKIHQLEVGNIWVSEGRHTDEQEHFGEDNEYNNERTCKYIHKS